MDNATPLRTSLRRPGSSFPTNANDARSSGSQIVSHVDGFDKGGDVERPCLRPPRLTGTLTSSKAPKFTFQVNLENEALSKKANTYISTGEKCCGEKIKLGTLENSKNVEKVDYK